MPILVNSVKLAHLTNLLKILSRLHILRPKLLLLWHEPLHLLELNLLLLHLCLLSSHFLLDLLELLLVEQLLIYKLELMLHLDLLHLHRIHIIVRNRWRSHLHVHVTYLAWGVLRGVLVELLLVVDRLGDL